MELEPKNLTLETRYKILMGCIVPRPIAFISTVSPKGTDNLAPYSFFNAVGGNPMGVMFAARLKPDMSEKDTLRNARLVTDGGTGEFVVNLAVETYALSVSAAAEPLPYEKSEFDLTNLTPVPSKVVRPMRIAESPVAFECRTIQVLPIAGSNVVFGEVVHVFIRDDLSNERFHIDADKLAAIGRMAGGMYCRTHDQFEMSL